MKDDDRSGLMKRGKGNVVYVIRKAGNNPTALPRSAELLHV